MRAPRDVIAPSRWVIIEEVMIDVVGTLGFVLAVMTTIAWDRRYARRGRSDRGGS